MHVSFVRHAVCLAVVTTTDTLGEDYDDDAIATGENDDEDDDDHDDHDNPQDHDVSQLNVFLV